MTERGTLPEGSASIPQPRVGAGSTDLVTDSQDAAVLRDLLARARERLSFYESFDRIIGENIKRSGELMLETIQLREQAETNAREAAEAKAQFDARLNAERKRHHDLLAALSKDLDQLRGQIDTFHTRLNSTITSIDGLEPAAPAEPAATEPVATATEAAAAPASEPEPAPATPPESEEPARAIDALFHGIPDAGTALKLQRFIGDIGGINRVEAREFAEGILRLQVTANRPLRSADFSAWSGAKALRITREQPHVIEATLIDA
jgi:hypothetical protein